MKLAAGFCKLRESEIQHLDVAVMPEHYVFRFDVAMNYSVIVRGRKRASYLNSYVDRFAQTERVFVHAVAQGLTVNEFCGDEMTVFRLPDLEYSDDVRMIERRCYASLLL